MTILTRLQAGLQAGYQAARGASTTDQFVKNLDEVVLAGQLANVAFADDEIAKQIGEAAIKNNVEIYNTGRTLSALYAGTYSRLFSNIQSLNDPNKQYPHGDPRRDFVLSEFWKHEPLLAGAVYSMTAKMSSLSWTVTGKKRLATYFANIYNGALSMNNHGWGDFISATSQDFYTLDRGAFWVTPRTSAGILTELGVLDGLCCALTGNNDKPIFYNSYVTGQSIWFKPGEATHFASMVSPREELFGMGLCAVSRAYKSARILIGLTNYDWEKLNNLPPEGVAAVTGLTMDEFRDSLAMWQAARKQNNSLTYPQVLWLLSSQPNTQVGIDFVGFSQIPESFDRDKVIEQYVNMLALVFGVDAREFWPISTSSLGTAAESEIQHMKAKGKGPGEFISVIERWFNLPHNMPEGVDFSFDTQDIGEDMTSAEVAKAWVEAFMPLYMPKASGQPGQPGQPGRPQQPMGAMGKSPQSPTKQDEEEEDGEEKVGKKPTDAAAPTDKPLISREQFLRLLIDRRVLPNWIIDDKRTVVTDVGVMEKELEDLDPEQPITIRWKNQNGAGIFEITRPATYEIRSEQPAAVPQASQLYPYAQKRSSTEFGAIQPDSAAILRQLKQLADTILDDELERNIHGKPLPDTEALRGPRVTKNSIKAELQRWMDHPTLSQYVNGEEFTKILEDIQL